MLSNWGSIDWILVLKRSAEVSVNVVAVKLVNEPEVPCINDPLKDPLNTPWPVKAKDAEVAKFEIDAVASGDRVFARKATEAVWARMDVEDDVAVTVDAKEFERNETDDVWALMAVEAEVAVTVGARAFARKATEDVCASIAVDADVAVINPVKFEPSPWNEPLNEPLNIDEPDTFKDPVMLVEPDTSKDPLISTELVNEDLDALTCKILLA